MPLSLSRFFLYVSLVSIVIVIPSTFFPFIGGKYYFFRVAAEASLAFLLIHWAFDERGQEVAARFKAVVRHPLFIAVSIFVAAFLLAVLFADNPHGAFWSNYERGEGGFQMLHYYAFFVLLLMLFTDEKHWKKAFYVSCGAGILMILYGVAAAAFVPGFIGPYLDATGAPVASTVLGRLFSSVRFQGSLGNPAYVAPYLMFLMFYIAYLVVAKERETRWKLWLSVALIVFFFLFFILSQTRGAFLGLLVAAFAFLLYLLLFQKRFRRAVAIIFLCVAIIGGVLLAFRNTAFIKSLPGSRLLFIDSREDSAQTRLWTWGSAWRGIEERPVFGWGPENFSTVFDKYFNPRHYKIGQPSETWFDRAHSVVFDYLAETGFVGFFAYLSMFAVFLWNFFKTHRRGLGQGAATRESWQAAVTPAILFVIPIAYFIQALVLFDVLPIYTNLFLFLALAQHLFMKVQAQES